MQRFFIADIHLNDNEPGITTGFLHFLNELPSESELYILGDLFDYWIGDDDVSPLNKSIALALNALKNRNIQTYFIHGNRDFLVGPRFAKQSRMQLLPDIELLNSNQLNVLILHGDLLCTDDESYQRFRRKIHNKWLQRLFLWLPRCIRRKIATRLRGESQHHNQIKSEYIMDVNQETVNSMVQAFQADIMIHGHTHKPAVHDFTIDDKLVKRFVLGAWHDGINYIHQNENGDIELLKIGLDL